MKTKLGRFLTWSFFNGGILACAWLGLIHGEEWALNVLRFASGSVVVAGLVCFTDHARNAALKRGRSVPALMSGLMDLALIVMCAATGHFWMATAWLWSAIAEAALYTKPETKGGAQ